MEAVKSRLALGVGIGVLFGLGLGLAGGFGLGMLAAPKPANPFAPQMAALADSMNPSSAEIAAHSFWKVKVNAAQVDGLVARIRAEKSSTVVFIDDQFKVGVIRAVGETQSNRFVPGQGPTNLVPDNIGKRFIYLDLEKEFFSQPSPEQVRSRIASSIRIRDYKD